LINNILKWVACIVTLAGAICTSENIYPFNLYFLNVGAVFYLAWAVRIRENNLIVINAAFLIIYLYGVLK